MVHNKLYDKVVLEQTFEYRSDPMVKATIDTLCRRLVMTMRSAEEDGIMEHDDIEKCVLACIANAEVLYYSLEKDEFEMLVEREVANEKARRRSKNS